MRVYRSSQCRSPLSRFPSWGLYGEREAPFPKPSLTCLNVAFRVSSNGALPPGSSHRAALEMFLLQNALLLSLKVPGETSLPLGFAGGPLWRKMLVSRAFHYISFRATSRGALPLGYPHIAPIERERERERDGYTRSQGQRGDTEKYIGKVEQQIAESVC